MNTVTVKTLADLNVVPFMEIKPSDVLISNNLIQKLRRGETKTSEKYFFWAQSSCSLFDIWLQEKEQEPLKLNEFGNPVLEYEILPRPKVEAYLPAKDAEHCFGPWAGKRIAIPLSEYELDGTVKLINPFDRNVSGAHVSDLNDGAHYFDKQCWVLRKKNDSDVHPMAVAHFISDFVRKTSNTFDSLEQIETFILGLKLDREALFHFHASEAKDYPKEINYPYKGILMHDCAEQWVQALDLVSASVVCLADIEKPLRKIGLAEWARADSFRDLNNKLGALFLTPSEYESFVRSGSLGQGVPIRLNDPEYSSNWMKTQTAHRGQAAIRAFYEIYGRSRRESVHFSSSPIKRVFALKLLRILPAKEVVLKKSDMVLEEAFFDEHGADIGTGKKIRAATDHGGKVSKQLTAQEYGPEYKKAKQLIQKRHDEYPDHSWSKVTAYVSQNVKPGASTLRKKFSQDDFRDPWKKYKKK